MHGHVYLNPSDIPHIAGQTILNTGDLILFNGKYYLPYPPLPSLILIPFLAINYFYVNSVFISVLLTCLNFTLVYRLYRQIDVPTEYLPWLIYGTIFGTSYWFVLLSSHHVYAFAETTSITLILLLITELYGKCRAVLLGLLLSCSFFCRQFTIFIVIFVIGYFIYKFKQDQHKNKLFIRKLILFLVPISIALIIFFAYNYIRFSNPLDTGYGHLEYIGVFKARRAEYGTFSFHYIPINLYYYLLKGFNIQFSGADMMKIVDVDTFGTALLIASPFLLSAFRAKCNRTLKLSIWVTISCILSGFLLYHSNGKDQVNASRFTLDFLPLLLILMAYSIKRFPFWLLKSLIIYSISLNIIAFSIHFLYHTL